MSWGLIANSESSAPFLPEAQEAVLSEATWKFSDATPLENGERAF